MMAKCKECHGLGMVSSFGKFVECSTCHPPPIVYTDNGTGCYLELLKKRQIKKPNNPMAM